MEKKSIKNYMLTLIPYDDMLKKMEQPAHGIPLYLAFDSANRPYVYPYPYRLIRT